MKENLSITEFKDILNNSGVPLLGNSLGKFHILMWI